ncbi:MAG: co-chaperone DjlA [Gammaproteobacteria bacterium]|nr:co-chaperone DjlA [Gammaproteobacteria bacterium]MCW8924492.1 co-chaperone DjlA [Gammaproteobacteria bacterium]
MAWWGKLIGGTLGYMFGGPLGALLGVALGGNFDRGLGLSDQFEPGAQERVQAAFFSATFSIMGHIAKADGKVTPDEVASARHIMNQMQLNSEQLSAAKKLFNEGKNPEFPLDAILSQFKSECHRRRNLIQMFLEIQIAMAMADGQLHKNEKQLIYHIGQQLGFAPAQIDQLFSFASGSAHTQQDKTHLLKDAYTILGMKPSDSDADIKKAYRRLMSQHHPDKLVAKGLPEEMVKVATEKTKEIHKAYDLIKSSRN